MDNIEYLHNQSILIFNQLVKGVEPNLEPFVTIWNNINAGKDIQVCKLGRKFVEFAHEKLNKSVTLWVNCHHENVSLASYMREEIFCTDKHVHTNGDCICEYHTESLATHLTACMLYMLDCSNDDPVMGFLGYLHDVGKPASLENIPKRKRTSFFNHGPLGSEMIHRIFGEDREMSLIAAVTSQHMCGYSRTDSENDVTQSVWSVLNGVLSSYPYSEDAKRAISYLRIADKEGRIPEKDKTVESCNESMDAFVEALQKPFNTKLIPFKKLCIALEGSSGSGKSTFAEILVKELEKIGIKAVHIDRDFYKSQIVAKHMGIELPKEKYHGDEYAKMQKYYEINITELAPQLNKKMNKIFHKSIASGKVPIIDTLAVRHPKSLAKIIDTSGCFVIQVTVSSDFGITQQTADRLGLTIKEQLELSGNQKIGSVYPDGVKYGQTLRSRMELSNGVWSTKVRNPCVRSHMWIDSFGTSHGVKDVVSLVFTFQDLIQKEKEIDSMPAVKLFNNLVNERGIEETIQFFKSKFYKVIKQHDNCYLISYLDGVNQNWTKWGRECRGIVLLKVNDSFVCVKRLLQRGAEMLTTVHKNHNINSTENVTKNKEKLLDSYQRNLLNMFLSDRGGVIKGYVSVKVDGCLVGINRYTGVLRDNMYRVIQDSERSGEFHKKLAKYCMKNDMALYLFSTNGTLFATDEMLMLIVTSILESKMFNINRSDINGTAWKALKPYLKELLEKFEYFYENLPEKTLKSYESISFSFECVCKGKFDAFGNKLPSLAIVHSHSNMYFLGISFSDINGKYEYRTHCQLSDYVEQSGFYQPWFWHVSHTGQVIQMIQYVEKFIRNKITQEQFFEKFPVNNTMNIDPALLCEGFVLFTLKDLSDDINTVTLDYEKIKTYSYYICHKFRPHNINDLQELAESNIARKVFPLLNIIVKQSTYNLRENYIQFFAWLKTHISNLLTSDDIDKFLNPKAVKSFHKQPEKRQIAMLCTSQNMLSCIYPVICEYFNFLPKDIPSDMYKNFIKLCLKDFDDDFPQSFFNYIETLYYSHIYNME